jgi:hypothetical protein
MERSFVETQVFMNGWRSSGLTDSDLLSLQQLLLQDPTAGDVIQGTGGLRKLRIKAGGRGKRAGGRLIYKDYPLYGYLVLIFLYRKANKIDLKPQEKKAIAAALNSLETVLERLASGRRSKQ